MERKAQAHWEGNLKEGKGSLNSQSGALKNINYSFKTRFEEGVTGTNPEELLAAAHAGCFTMSVSSMLTKKSIEITSLETVATVKMENQAITGIHLSITGSLKGLSNEEFNTITKDAEKNCIISKALSIPISSEAKLITNNQAEQSQLSKTNHNKN